LAASSHEASGLLCARNRGSAAKKWRRKDLARPWNQIALLTKAALMFEDKIIWTRSLEDWPSDVRVLKSALEHVVHLPCIRTEALTQPLMPKFSQNQAIIAVFGSAKAVEYSLANAALTGLLKRARRILALGSKTAACLQERGFRAETDSRWRGMADLAAHLTQSLSGSEAILAPGPKTRAMDLAELLEELDIDYIPVDVYETHPGLRGANDELLLQTDIDRLQRELAGVVCFASPSAVIGFTKWLSPDLFGLRERLRVACIGETTQRKAIEHFDDCHVCPLQSVESLFSTALELGTVKI
jgi:uroporphyrinogen-III synthase